MLTPPLILGSTALNSGLAITFNVVSHLSLGKTHRPTKSAKPQTFEVFTW